MGIKISHTHRYREIVLALVRHGFGYMVEEMGLFQLLSLPRKWLQRNHPEASKTLGERIRMLLEELGPTFIKLGQMSSTRHDLLPEEIIVEFQKLQDQVPAFSFEEVRIIIEMELQCPLEEAFAEFQEAPFAAASIGQVHYARLKTSEVVAVKVQRPSVDQIVRLDLEILNELAALAERRVGWVARYQIRRMIEELSKSMLEEINYTREGRNADKSARQFALQPNVHIPKIYWDYSTPKVLTMELVEGIKLNEAEKLFAQGHDLKKITELLVNAMLHQMLIEGFFHADPHPGNIFVLKEGKIAFVDFGMVGRLNEDMKFDLCSLVIALMRKDNHGIIQAILSLGLVSEDFDTRSLEKDLELLREQYYDLPLSQVSLSEAFSHFFEVANRHGMVIPTDLTLLGKALLILEGVAETLDPELSILKLAEPFGRRLLKDRYHPQQLQKRWWRQISGFTGALMGLPKQATQLSKLIRTGKLKMEIAIPEIDLLLHKLDQVSNRITVSIVLLSFSIIMVGLILASSLGTVPALILRFPVVEVGSSVAGLMLLWLIYSIFKNR
ncbi:MAG: AarF/ABC1/UbiB kinase family protein [Paenibacillaceae bacterium]